MDELKLTKVASGHYRVDAGTRQFEVQRCGDAIPRASRYIWCLYAVTDGVRDKYITSFDTRKQALDEIVFIVNRID